MASAAETGVVVVAVAVLPWDGAAVETLEEVVRKERIVAEGSGKLLACPGLSVAEVLGFVARAGDTCLPAAV